MSILCIFLATASGLINNIETGSQRWPLHVENFSSSLHRDIDQSSRCNSLVTGLRAIVSKQFHTPAIPRESRMLIDVITPHFSPGFLI
ncbi:hypothetical protein BGY98DRAFT_594381 [Russula aff. rugulosa BPL654]|nr:hypothetical protein BGY98DRAFT_594381 [Russula aff. rugulosa BPL654]